MFRFKKLVFCLVGILVSLVGWGQQELTLKLQQGKNYLMELETSTRMVQKILAEVHDTTTTLRGTLNFQVKEIRGNSYVFETSLKQISQEEKSGDYRKYSGSDLEDSTDLPSIALSGMVNQPFRIVMDESGNVSDMQGFEQAIMHGFSRFHLTEEQLLFLKNYISSAIDEIELKDDIELVTAISPGQPVDESETWSITTSSGSEVKILDSSTYTLERVSDDQFELTSKGVIHSSEEQITVNGMPLIYHLKGNSGASYLLDRQSRWIKEAKIHMEASGTIEFLGTDQLPFGLIVPVTIISDTKVKGSHE
jgi:Family of unknown function (DUF6263)